MDLLLGLVVMNGSGPILAQQHLVVLPHQILAQQKEIVNSGSHFVSLTFFFLFKLKLLHAPR